MSCFGIYGIGGMFGAILTGVFATSAVNPIFKDSGGNILPVGLIDGNPAQIVNQLIGVGMAIVLPVGGSILILKFVDLVIGLRVSEKDETVGLDATQHGETAYIFEGDLIHSSGGNQIFLTEKNIEIAPSKLVLDAD